MVAQIHKAMNKYDVNIVWPPRWPNSLRTCLVWQRSGVQISDQPNPTRHCKRFATASTSTQVAVLPWRYDTVMGTANSLHASA